MREPVRLGADTGEHLALELDVELLGAERGRRRFGVAKPREALRVEERAEPRGPIHFHAFGVDGETLRAIDEQELAVCSNRRRVPGDFVGEQLQVAALDLDRAGQFAFIFFAVVVALAGGDDARRPCAVVEWAGLRLRPGRCGRQARKRRRAGDDEKSSHA